LLSGSAHPPPVPTRAMKEAIYAHATRQRVNGGVKGSQLTAA